MAFWGREHLHVQMRISREKKISMAAKKEKAGGNRWEKRISHCSTPSFLWNLMAKNIPGLKGGKKGAAVVLPRGFRSLWTSPEDQELSFVGIWTAFFGQFPPSHLWRSFPFQGIFVLPVAISPKFQALMKEVKKSQVWRRSRTLKKNYSNFTWGIQLFPGSPKSWQAAPFLLQEKDGAGSLFPSPNQMICMHLFGVRIKHLPCLGPRLIKMMRRRDRLLVWGKKGRAALKFGTNMKKPARGMAGSDKGRQDDVLHGITGWK